MTQADRWANDLAFVRSEIIRFARMDPQVILRDHAVDSDFTVPHPDGQGDLICGQEAGRRLTTIAEDVLTRPTLRARLSAHTVREHTKREFSHRFLQNDRQIDRRSAQRLLSAVEKSVARELVNLTHYIPCHVVTGEAPKLFEIGPVKFRPRRIFLEELSEDLDRYVNSSIGLMERQEQDTKRTTQGSPDHARRWVEQLRDGLLAHFSGFEWIAEVSVCRCEPAVSRQRARQTVESALDILRLILGEHHSDRMRVSGTPLAPLEGAQLTRASDGTIDISLSRSWNGQGLGKHWWSLFQSPEVAPRMAAASIALASVASMAPDHPLCERFIDAAGWYGQAILETSPAAKTIKYMTSIERIVLADSHDEVTSTVVARAAALCVDPGDQDHSRWRALVTRLYDARSRLVHGSMSPYSPTLERIAWDTGDVARCTLIRGLDLFSELNLSKKITTKELNRALATHVERILSIAPLNCVDSNPGADPAKLRTPFVRATRAKLRQLRQLLRRSRRTQN